MYWMKNQSRRENSIYLVLWGALFAAPLLSMYVRTVGDSSAVFSWQEALMVWQKFGIFLLLFLLHDIFLAPLLVYQHRRLLYGTLVVVIVAAFSFYQCSSGPRHRERRGPQDMTWQDRRPPRPSDFMEEEEMPRPPERHGRPGHRHGVPPAIIGEHDIVAVVLLLLMFGMNIAIKGYYKTRRDQLRLKALEQENLTQQLEYLKYQINPHFFMNTLNNIHALVDIDAERAKETILELSKMMRFILYEGDKNGVPLSKEFDFIRHYVTLMRLRYTDKVSIRVDLPTEVPDKTVPPLMLISFIENAFKHGISYQHPSFIDIKTEVSDGRLYFRCHNSKADTPNQEKGGVGLNNVKQRLKLLYDNNFTLNIQDNPDTYLVELTIPLI